MYHKTLSARIIQIVLILILAIVSFVALVPILHVLATSLSSPTAALQSRFLLFPREITLDAYRFILSASSFWNSMGVSLRITIVGTFLRILVTFMLAYALAHRDLPGAKVMSYAVLFTMIFNAGMIPTFMTVVGYGLRNTLWALMLPTLIDPFNLIIIRTFISNIPKEIEESAKIDGCNDVRILFTIIVPLSMAAIATFSLFYAVALWNAFFDAILYISDPDLFPVQVLLRQVIMQGAGMDSAADDIFVPPRTVRMAVIIASTLPIMMVYPFIQKHFAKGVMLGSVKG